MDTLIKANIAVLVTVYNREMFLEQLCIEIDKHILNHENVKQVVFLDDFSSDSSFEILTKFKFNHIGKVSLYKNELNLGQFRTRNKILEYVNEDINILKYLDSDDLPYPHTIVDFLNSYEIYPRKGIYVSASRAHFPNKFPFIYDKRCFLTDYINNTLIAEGPSSWFISKDLINRVGRFNENGKVNEDIVLLTKSFLESDAVIIRPSNIWYRIHNGQELTKGILNFEYEKYEYIIDETVIKHCSPKQKKQLKELRFREFLKLVYLLKFRKAILKLNTWRKIA